MRSVSSGDDDGFDVGILDHRELARCDSRETQVTSGSLAGRPGPATNQLKASPRRHECGNEHAGREAARTDEPYAHCAVSGRGQLRRFTYRDTRRCAYWRARMFAV